MESVVSSVASQLLLNDAAAVHGAQFLKDAEQHGLWHPQTVHGPKQSLTIFVPLNRHYKSGDYACFAELWNRHVVNGKIHVANDGVRQLTTRGNLVFALYKQTAASSSSQHSAYAVGGVPISEFWDVEHNGCIFHGVAAAHLPDIRPAPGYVSTLKTCYLSGEHIDLQFLPSGIERADKSYTMVLSMNSEDRTPIAASQKLPWQGNGTRCEFVVPDVFETVRAMLWLCIFDNTFMFPIITTTLPWSLILVPNIDMHRNLHITHILPKTGHVDGELWIAGSGFSKKDIRVTIGRQAALIHHCEPTLIRCCIPKGQGQQIVWAANGNVYTRYSGSFTYAEEHDGKRARDSIA